MARTPPQAASPRHHQHARAGCRDNRPATSRRWPCSPVCGLLADAHARTHCEEWSADITLRRGARRGTAQRRPRLGSRSRPASAFAPATPFAAKARAARRSPCRTAARLRLDENSALALPEPPSGLGSLLELLRGIIHVISRDPRSLTLQHALRQRRPRGNRVRHSRRRERRVYTEIVVLEGEVAVTTPRGRAQSRERPCRASRKTGEAPTASPLRIARSSACAGRATTRRSSIGRCPAQTKSRPRRASRRRLLRDRARRRA